MIHPRRIAHVTGVIALVAVAASAVFTFAYPSIWGAGASESPVYPATGVTTSNVESEETLPETTPANEPGLTEQAVFGMPMTNALARVTKKPFGLEVHPETSPVKNDRFNGFHVGVDFEITEEEADIDVPVFAICDGPLLSKAFANGYGGYALQRCTLNEEEVIVLYGHLNLARITATPQQQLTRGEPIGVLGKGYSPETDGVRKHLHLGIHRGTDIDIRGYVQETSEVSNWLDVLPYLQP